MKKIVLMIFILCFIILQSFSQTNVSGEIANNTIWTLENSPYRIVGDIKIVNSATLTIEKGCEVIIETESAPIIMSFNSIYVGDKNSPGRLIADSVKFIGKDPENSVIRINTDEKGNTSSGYFQKSFFDSCMITISDESTANLTEAYFKNCRTPVLLSDANGIFTGIRMGQGVEYPGITLSSTFTINDTLKDWKYPYYIGNVSLRDGAVLTFEKGDSILFKAGGELSIIGESLLIADSVSFIGALYYGNFSPIIFSGNGNGNSLNGLIINSRFEKCEIAIEEGSSANLTNSYFNHCRTPIILSNANGIFNDIKLGPEIVNAGLGLSGAFTYSDTLTNWGYPYYIVGTTFIKNHAILTIEKGCEVIIETESAPIIMSFNSIYVGDKNSPGRLIADSVNR